MEMKSQETFESTITVSRPLYVYTFKGRNAHFPAAPRRGTSGRSIRVYVMGPYLRN